MGNRGLIKLLALLVATIVAFPTHAWALKKSEANSLIPEGEYLVKSGRRVAAHKAKKKSRSSAARSSKKSGKKVAKAKSSHSSRSLASKSKSGSHKNKTKKKKHAVKAKSRKSDHRSANRAKSRHRAVVKRNHHEEREESDLPMVSAPHRKVVREDQTIVMEDPAVKAPLPKPRKAGATLTPGENVLDPDSEEPPSEVSEAKAAAAPPAPPPAPVAGSVQAPTDAAAVPAAPAEPSTEIVGPAPASVAAPEEDESEEAEQTPEGAVAHEAAATATREPDAFDLHSGGDPMRGP